MTSFDRNDDLAGADFVNVDLRGARIVESDLSGTVMRGVEVSGVEIDAPWLVHGEPLLVNGVDVVGYVESELDSRFPGRFDRRSTEAPALRAAWAAVERTWDATVERATQMPAGTVDASVDGEWSFAQTLRHLVLATDVWLRKAVLGIEQPFHPLGLAGPGTQDLGLDMSVFVTETPSWDEVLAARADRVAQVREFLADVTAEELDTARTNPWAPQKPETTRSCLHVVLEEEWEHLRYAVRDLDALAA